MGEVVIPTQLVDSPTGTPLYLAGDHVVRENGSVAARIEEGIVCFPDAPDTDMHIPALIPDIHDALRTRTVLGQRIDSDVEWVMRHKSLTYMRLHGRRLACLKPGAVVADLECGQLPYWTALPHDRIAEYYGFDGDLPSLRRAAREFASDPRLRLIWSVAERTPVPDGVFDAVISSEVIEHVENPSTYLREAWRILKPGGYLTLSTPCASMYLWPSEILKVAVGRISPLVYWKRLTPERHWHEALAWHPALRPRVLAKWLNEAGFEVVLHNSTLWNTQTVLGPARRLFNLAEKLFNHAAGRYCYAYLNACDRVTESKLPLVRFLGLRQFVFARKSQELAKTRNGEVDEC